MSKNKIEPIEPIELKLDFSVKREPSNSRKKSELGSLATLTRFEEPGLTTHQDRQIRGGLIQKYNIEKGNIYFYKIKRALFK